MIVHDKKATRTTKVWSHPRLMTKGEGDALVVCANLPNAILVLRLHPQWAAVLAYDEFLETVITTRPPAWDTLDAPQASAPGEWTDTDSARCVSWFSRRMHMAVSIKLVEEAVQVVADTRRVHPVRDWLRSLKWDGKKRLDSWLIAYAGAIDTAYVRGIGPKWLISAVARVEKPGCQVDYALIFESMEQGKDKSKLCRALVPKADWFSETPINISNKDGMQALRGIWILSLDELDSVRRSEHTKTKNFLTKPHDRYRPSYGRRTRNYARQCVFCGTTNEPEYLTDPTGNRRYWPVTVGAIDVQALKRDRDQLWAEAFARYKAKEKWWPDAELERLCGEEQADRVLPDDWMGPIRDWCENHDDGSGVRTVDVLCGAIKVELAKIDQHSETPRAAKVLRLLGYTRDRARTGDKEPERSGRKQQWRYVLPPTRAAEQAERFRHARGVRPVRPLVSANRSPSNAVRGHRPPGPAQSKTRSDPVSLVSGRQKIGGSR